MSDRTERDQPAYCMEETCVHIYEHECNQQACPHRHPEPPRLVASEAFVVPLEEYSDLEYATRLDGTTMPAPRVLPDQHCWCGGAVGAREPGDHLGLGCLLDITHNWNAADPS